MLQIEVNYMAVIVAAIANMAVGFMWFGPLFGKQWIKMMGWTPQQMQDAQKKGMAKSYILAFIASLITAWVLAELSVVVGSYLLLEGVSAGLKAGFLGWVGFALLVNLNSVIWEGKSWKLFMLNTGYYLVAFLVMGAIVGGM